jgi:putative ABC transport system permease protein
MLFGLAPALRLSRVDLQSALRVRRGDGVRHAHLRGALLIAEVALTVVLLVGAGLLVRSFLNVQRTNLGYRSADVAVLTLDLPHARYRDNNAHIAFYDRLLERLSSVPGVASVSGSTTAPGSQESMTFSFAIEGRQAANPSGREDPEELLAVGKRYFRTLGVPLLAGRDFDERDRAESPAVVIISQSLARKHWQNENPIGKRISFRPGQTPWMEIVGVIGDVRMVSPDQEPVPALYIPHAQKTNTWLTWYSVVARMTAGTDPLQLLPRMRAALWELDNQIPVQRFATVRELYGESMARRSFALVLVLGFALVALLLSVVGLYGLIAYMVAQQRQEIGVRIALGASQAEVLRTVLLRSLRLAATGVALGLLASLFTTRLLTTLLYNVTANDPATLLVISALVTTTAVVAAGIPALRAVRTSPLTALRG